MAGMIYVRPFSPVGETVSGTAGVVNLDRTGFGTQSVRVVNDGEATATVQFLGSPNYVGPKVPILGGSVETFLLPHRVSMANIEGADGTVYFTTGESA